MKIEIPSEQEMVQLGHQLATVLEAGDTISLQGTLGAGKTRLVQAIAEKLGVTEEVTSPTYVLVNEYSSGSMPIYHFDAYRLKDEDEFLELGPDEYFEGYAPAGAGLTFVEWGERVASCLPEEVIRINIEVLSGESRLLFVEGMRADALQKTDKPKSGLTPLGIPRTTKFVRAIRHEFFRYQSPVRRVVRFR